MATADMVSVRKGELQCEVGWGACLWVTPCCLLQRSYKPCQARGNQGVGITLQSPPPRPQSSLLWPSQQGWGMVPGR